MPPSLDTVALPWFSSIAGKALRPATKLRFPSSGNDAPASPLSGDEAPASSLRPLCKSPLRFFLLPKSSTLPFYRIDAGGSSNTRYICYTISSPFVFACAGLLSSLVHSPSLFCLLSKSRLVPFLLISLKASKICIRIFPTRKEKLKLEDQNIGTLTRGSSFRSHPFARLQLEELLNRRELEILFGDPL